MTEAERDQKVVKDLLAGDSLCDHPNLLVHGNKIEGGSRGICCVCMLGGPLAPDYNGAREAFWKQSAITRGRYIKLLTKEKPMSTEDYKRGVEDALGSIEANSNIMYYGADLQRKKENIRKKLLTKKVTKWVNVYKKGEVLTVAPAPMDEEKVARGHSGYPGGNINGIPAGGYFGSYPIEIELPL